MKKILLLAAAALALTSAVSADVLIPPCILDGSCRVDVR
jgi:opacity protein-like surface antigen